MPNQKPNHLISYPNAWILYLYDFHVTRDYFECHEHLEEYWKETQLEDPSLVAFIQVAVGAYHARRGNVIGAQKMWERARAYFAGVAVNVHGIDIEQLNEDIKDWQNRIVEGHPFEDANFPILDVELKNKVVEMAKQKGRTYGGPSDLSNLELIDRHKRRDRSEVITNRLNSLVRKRGISIDNKFKSSRLRVDD